MKFFKWFFLGLGFWIILIMLITYPINTRAGAVSSVTLSDKAVTFYSPNGREEIYSLNVPFGSSLQDVEDSNILLNSAFLINTRGFDVYTYNSGGSILTVDDWYLRGGSGTTFTTDGRLLSAGGWGAWFIQTIEPDKILNNTTYYINFSFENIGSSATFIDFGWQNTSFGNTAIKTFSFPASSTIVNSHLSFDLNFEEPDNFLRYYLRIYNQTNGSTQLHYVSLSTSSFDYFDSSYLDYLYSNSGYDITNLSWSESPYTSIPFSYNVPIEFNTNLYPTMVTESFSLTDSWQSLLTGLDKNYMTFNTFQDLVETFEDLTDPNNLKVDNFIDVFKALWFLLKSVFVLLYNVLMLIIAPFVDLFVMLISALFSGLDFWILI